MQESDLSQECSSFSSLKLSSIAPPAAAAHLVTAADRDDDHGSGAGDDDDGIGDGDDGEGLDDDPEVNYRDPPEGYLRLRPSQFQHIPATVFVEYPPELGPLPSSPLSSLSDPLTGLTRNDFSQLEKLGRRKLHYTCHWGRNCVKNAFR